MAEMCKKHGPVDMLIEPDPRFDDWPDGIVLVGVEIVDTITSKNGITHNIEYARQRAIRTGLARRIFGP